METGNSASKFKLDGSIETPKESTYLVDQLRKKLSRIKFLVGLLLALLAITISLMVWGFLNLTTTESELQKIQEERDETMRIAGKNDSLFGALANLHQENLRLHSDNELLIENSDRLDGIFYEVLIGGFEDFALSRYLEDLARVRKEEYNGRTHLVLARFLSFKKALLFENDIKRIGLNDVMIVGRVDGKMVPFKEALEAGQNRK